MTEPAATPVAGSPGTPVADAPGSPAEPTLRRVCAELIALRERNDRQHRLFEQTLAQTRDDLQARFDRFAADTQQAYQRLREDLTGEKRHSLALLNALADLALDLQKVVAARPQLDDHPQAAAWAEGVAVAARRAEAVLAQFGVHRYDAVVAAAYQPALHERVGGRAVEGLAPQRVAQQIEPGYASQQPDFVLRRAKVLTTE
ncbi:MAG TPA: nucleotide exchange factor GrpE [Gemmataceae bacterium]|jgi:molecular chaperone GrpE (heat shock protein)